jgi:predicted TIM-barrel fold metal-dependent hydrolase
MKLMAADNVAAEVLNPTWGLWIPRISDPALRNACAEVYNDWILEYCSENLKRLLPIAMTPITDVDWAVGELQRVVKRGARGVMIGTNPVDADTTPYRDTYYDRFWAAAEESGLPVTLHIVTGRVRDPFTYHGAKERQAVAGTFIEMFQEAARCWRTNSYSGESSTASRASRCFCLNTMRHGCRSSSTGLTALKSFPGLTI